MQKPSRPAIVLTSAACLLAFSGRAPAQSPAPSAAMTTATSTDNPLLSESTLPYHMPPFDRIKDEDYEPAFEKGMALVVHELGHFAM